MIQQKLRDYQSGEPMCPTCGRVFDTETGVSVHHTQAHESPLRYTLICEECGDRKDILPWRSSRSRFCSEGCKYKSFESSYRGEGNPQYNSEEVPCSVCGESLTRPACNVNDRNFCSRECQSIGFSGKGSPRWSGGKSIYHAMKALLPGASWGWIRQHERGDKCEMCGESAEKLDLHHIIPLLAGGVNEEWNYMTLCRSCHITVEHYTSTITNRPFIDG